MLPHFDKYEPYVFASYSIAIAVLGGLIAWSILRAQSAKKKLDAIEGEKPSGDKPA